MRVVCASAGYPDRRSLVALIGPERLRAHLGLVANRIADELPRELAAAVRESLLGLLSKQTSLSHPSIGDLWRAVCDGCDLGLRTLLTAALPGKHRALRRLLAERLLQCCVHVATRGAAGGDQWAPFCAVQDWPALGATRLSITVSTPAPGRALPLPVVRTSRESSP